MANPALLFLDADVLFQLFLCNALKALRLLPATYGVAPVMVPEVHAELLSNKKFKGLFDAGLAKALSKGPLSIFDKAACDALVATSNVPIQPGVTYAHIQRIGDQYYRRVDRGEAYTHAAATALGQPAASNDFNAIETLATHGFDIPIPVLRTFDLFTFGFNVGALTASECDGFRQTLTKEKEYVPKAFIGRNFSTGLSHFTERLVHTAAEGHIKRVTPLYRSTLCLAKT